MLYDYLDKNRQLLRHIDHIAFRPNSDETLMVRGLNTILGQWYQLYLENVFKYNFTPRKFELKRQPIQKINM